MKIIEILLSCRDRLIGLGKVNRQLRQALQELADVKQELAKVLFVVERLRYATSQDRPAHSALAAHPVHTQGGAHFETHGAARPDVNSAVVPKIGFIVHNLELLNHFRCVWALLPADTFDVIVYGDDEHDEIHREISAMGIHAVDARTLLTANIRYRHVVSNHIVAGDDPSLLKRLGERNIRFMYSAGKSGWNLREWNSLYDVILCFGPYHADLLSKQCRAVIVQMGYPRLDRLFTSYFDKAALQKTFRCDPKKKTVVWLPTWKALSSVGWFDQTISALLDEFNVVIKLHPLMARDDPMRIAALDQFTFNCVIKDSTDNLPLYALADFLLCDYGGPALAGIYADKNLVLLNVPGAATDELTGPDSPDISIRDNIINVDIDQAETLGKILGDDSVWESQGVKRARLRQIYFSPYQGFSSTVAASALLNLDNILASGKHDMSPEKSVPGCEEAQW
jgi:hypothetical protein